MKGKGGMGNPNGLKCPRHGLLLVDVSGAGHSHPSGAEHGSFTTRCPHVGGATEYYLTGEVFDCRYERTVEAPCPEDREA